MKHKLVLTLTFILLSVSTGLGQTQLTIKKTSSMTIPGMPMMPKMPPGMANPMDSMNNRKSTVYIKGSRMRIDMFIKDYSSKEDLVQTTIVQCDKQRSVQFNSKKNKYYVEPLSQPASESVKKSTKGGYVTVTASVIDTGERAKLFGYDSRHLKETIAFTPSKNACMKDAMTVEIDGWYADVPEFSCPIKRNMEEFKMDKNCLDDVDLQIKSTRTGIALKEIKKMTMNGMTVITEEEATEILKTPLSDSLFEPPPAYKPANTLKEIETESSDGRGAKVPALPSSHIIAARFLRPHTRLSGGPEPRSWGFSVSVWPMQRSRPPVPKYDPYAIADIFFRCHPSPGRLFRELAA